MTIAASYRAPPAEPLRQGMWRRLYRYAIQIRDRWVDFGWLTGESLPRDRFTAFISYRHQSPDRGWANWLHDRLETYYLPRELAQTLDRNQRLGRFCQDEREFPASADLGAEIKSALDRSEWLIVICSPRAKQSAWISAEIEYFVGIRGPNRVLSLLIDGEPSDAFPPPLMRVRDVADSLRGRTEPLAADVRPLQGGKKAERNEIALLRLIATLVKCSFDDLRLRDVQRQRRKLRSMLVIGITLVLILSGLGAYAELNRRTAEQQRVLAVQRARRGASLQTRLAAEEAAKGRGREAALLAREAIPDDPLGSGKDLYVTDARVELEAALFQPLERRRIRDDGLGGLAIMNPGGDWLVTAAGLRGIAQLGPNDLDTPGREDPTVSVWNANTGESVAVLTASAPVTVAAFSPDGRHLLTGAKDGAIELWDPAAGTAGSLLPYDPPTDAEREVWAVAFSPDGTRMLAIVDNALLTWDRDTRALVSQPLPPCEDGALPVGAFSRDRRYVVKVCGWTPTLVVFDLHDGQTRRIDMPNPGFVFAVAWDLGGQRLATGSSDGVVRLYDRASGDVLRTFLGHKQIVGSVVFTADGQRIVSGSDDGTAKLWDINREQAVLSVSGRGRPVSAVAVSSTGARICTASWPTQVWDISSGQLLKSLVHPQGVHDVAVEPTDRWIVSAGSDSTARVWDIGADEPRLILAGHTGPLTSVAISPDGRLIVTGAEDHTVRLWDAQTGQQVRILDKFDEAIRDVVFTRDGKEVVSSAGRVIRFAPVDDSRKGRQFESLEDVTALAISPTDILAAATSNELVLLWDIRTGQELPGLGQGEVGFSSVAFSPDGARVLASSDHVGSFVWEVRKPEIGDDYESASAPPLEIGDPGVTSVAYSSDGRFVLSGGQNSAMLDATTGRQLLSLVGQTGWITSATLDRSGSTAITASTDGSIRIWKLPFIPTQLGDLMAHVDDELALCPLSRDERRTIMKIDDELAALQSAGRSLKARLACGIAKGGADSDHGWQPLRE